MKLFYTRKQYGVLVDKIEILKTEKEKEIKILNDKNWKLFCDLSDANDEMIKALSEIDKLNKKIDQLKEKAKQEKKELKDKIKELEKKLEESMSDKYLVRKVRGTKPTKQTTKIKSSVKQSNAIKLVKEQL